MELINIPNNIDAEKALLGAIMLRPKEVFEVVSTISEKSFYSTKNADIYKAMLVLQKESNPIDLVSVTNKLRDLGKLESIGLPYLHDVLTDTPSSTNAKYYASIVKKNSDLRDLIEIGGNIVEFGSKSNESTDTASAINSFCNKLITIEGNSKERTDISEVIEEFDETQEMFKDRLLSGSREYIGIPCGISKIDGIIDGIRPGHIWAIAGYTSTGKTQFLLNMINSIMTTSGVAMFSLEMSKVDIIARLLSIETGLGASKILRHEFSEAWEVEEYQVAKKRLINSNFRIYSKTNNLDDIIVSMMREIVTNKTKVFAIDYIQLVRTRSSNEYEQISEAAQRLQNFARENNVSIIILSQVSNEHAKEQNKEVMGFKGGGTLPASADLAIELVNDDKREEREQKLQDKTPFNVSAMVKKNRHGRTGVINLYFSPWNGKFSENYM